MRINRIMQLAMIGIIAISMIFTPVIGADYSYASDEAPASTSMVDESPADTDLDGSNVLPLMLDKDKKDVLQDPMFYRYYDVSKLGVIHQKTFDDNMDKYNTPSPETADIEAEITSEMNCVGCGVSGLGKAQVPSKYKSYTRYNCLDISEWQGRISSANWKTIKAAGVTHVIIRVGGSYLRNGQSFSDTYYKDNINGAYAAGLKVGVYYFSQALTPAEATNEAAYTIKLIQSYKGKIKLPVVFDYESNEAGRLSGKKLKSLGQSGTAYKICQAFCEKVKSAGYEPMVYANYTTLQNYLNYKTLQSKYKIWLANYTTSGSATTYPGEYYAWQYSSSGRVNGLSGYVDMNYIFEKKSPAATTKPTTKPAATVNPTAPTGDDPAQTPTENRGPIIKKVNAYRAVTTSDVNYRTGPGLNYSKKGRFKKGTKITIKARCNVDGKIWGKMSNGYFIAVKYTKKYGYRVKTTKNLQYRKGPGPSYKKMGVFKRGKRLTIVKTKGSWGKTGNGYYINLKFTKKL